MKTRVLVFLLLGILACVPQLTGRPAVAQGATTVIIPRRTDPSQTISFSFQQAEIDDVLRFLADATGKIVFKDPSVVTQITIRNQSRLPVATALKLLGAILSLKNYALIETPDALIVTTATEARNRRHVKVTTGKDLMSIPEGKEIITHVFPLETADANRMRQELQPLFQGGGGVLIANGDTNSLVVIDEADTVRRMAQLIALIDRPLTDEINLEVIQLRFADATEVARYLSELFQEDPASRTGGFPFPMPGGPPGSPMANVQAQPGGLSRMRGRVRFAADERSNQLLVYATPANIKAVKEIVAQVDVNVTPRTEFRIVELKFADATGVSDQLNQLLDPSAQTSTRGFGGFGGFGVFGGFGGSRSNQGDPGLQDYRVVPDVRTNSLIITAPVDSVESLMRLISELDRPASVNNVVRIFSLKNAIASEVATTLRNLFLGQTQQGNLGFGLFGSGSRTQTQPNSPIDLLRQVTIVPNDQTNQLLITGPSQTFAVIEKLLDEQEGLDRKLPQVFIEVIIADITLDDEHKFGIEWNALSGSSAGATSFGLTSPTADNTGFRYSVLSRNFQASLHALQSKNNVRVVSTPHILVTDNSPAVVSIGERIPYAGETTITQGTVTASTEFADVAITLNVTPHISPGGHILMDIDQQVNSLIEFISIGQNQTAPRTTSRRAGTTVIVKNDQTVVLGGIISNNEQRKSDRIPILGDLPFIGSLFRNNTRSKGQTELVVFLTPHVVRDDADMEEIRKYERMRLNTDPFSQLQAPFKREGLDLTPQDIKKKR